MKFFSKTFFAWRLLSFNLPERKRSVSQSLSSNYIIGRGLDSFASSSSILCCCYFSDEVRGNGGGDRAEGARDRRSYAYSRYESDLSRHAFTGCGRYPWSHSHRQPARQPQGRAGEPEDHPAGSTSWHRIAPGASWRESTP